MERKQSLNNAVLGWRDYGGHFCFIQNFGIFQRFYHKHNTILTAKSKALLTFNTVTQTRQTCLCKVVMFYTDLR